MSHLASALPDEGGSPSPTASDGAPAGPRRVTSAIRRIRVESAVDAMADLLRTAILDGELEPGTLLPTERDLAQDSGLSRGSVRQALKALTVEGLVQPKVGRNGGYLVQQPPRASVVRSLDVFIRGRRIHHTSLQEVREVLEPECAALAAERRTDEALARLRELTHQMAGVTDDVHTFLDMNIDWHVAVADASGNEVFSSVMAAISANVRSAIGIDEYESPSMTRAAQHLHEIVLHAVEVQDPDAAERRMRRHLAATDDVLAGRPDHRTDSAAQRRERQGIPPAPRRRTTTSRGVAHHDR